MELLQHLALGFGVAVSPVNLMYAFIGVLVGTLIGVLPGIGSIATISMLLPATYALQPVSALIMLAGIYYGAQYGGSTAAILLNMPGETASAVTCLEGHKMARNGQAGAALAAAALASFFAGTVATLMIATVATPLSQLALKFGAAEFFSLMCLGLVGAVVLAHGSMLQAVSMVVLGLVLGLVGIDVNSGAQRYTFGIPELSDGLGVASVAMGLFGIAEIMLNLQSSGNREIIANKVNGLWLTKSQFRAAWPAALRGTALGSVLGLLPGGGAMLASFTSYAVEKKIGDNQGQFGNGAIQGVAGPEAANNAGAQASFIPLLTLGIPENAVMALMIGAMTIQNIQPGPQVMTSNPQLFWGLVVSMWIGNLMLVVLNLPLISIWVQLLRVPYRLLFPLVLVFCCIGIYTINNNAFDISQMAAFGLLGFFLVKLGCEPAPLLLGFVLGPMMEENLRRALVLSRGDFTVFVTQPISLALLLTAVALLLLITLPSFNKKREEVFIEKI